MASFCRSALRRLCPKTPASAPKAVPATPVSAHSMSSSITDEQLSYIDYKLQQYQIKLDEKTEQPTQPVKTLARKAKSKISSLFGKKQKPNHIKEVAQSDSRSDDFSSQEQFFNCRRDALEVGGSDRERVESEVALETIQAEFSGEEESVGGFLSHEPLDAQCQAGDYQSQLRDGPTSAQPTFEDASSAEAHYGVIVLEADGLQEIKPREFL